MVIMEMLQILSKISINGMCLDVVALSVITMRAPTFHPTVAMLLRGGFYLSTFVK